MVSSAAPSSYRETGTGLTRSVAGLTGSVAGLTGSVAGLTRSVAGLTGSVAGLTGSVAGLTGSVAGLTGSVARSPLSFTVLDAPVLPDGATGSFCVSLVASVAFVASVVFVAFVAFVASVFCSAACAASVMSTSLVYRWTKLSTAPALSKTSYANQGLHVSRETAGIHQGVSNLSELLWRRPQIHEGIRARCARQRLGDGVDAPNRSVRHSVSLACEQLGEMLNQIHQSCGSTPPGCFVRLLLQGPTLSPIWKQLFVGLLPHEGLVKHRQHVAHCIAETLRGRALSCFFTGFSFQLQRSILQLAQQFNHFWQLSDLKALVVGRRGGNESLERRPDVATSALSRQRRRVVAKRRRSILAKLLLLYWPWQLPSGPSQSRPRYQRRCPLRPEESGVQEEFLNVLSPACDRWKIRNRL
eukprot:scaffold228_cov312-Pinguiococcus_pyrenoidosus.AAC.69